MVISFSTEWWGAAGIIETSTTEFRAQTSELLGDILRNQ